MELREHIKELVVQKLYYILSQALKNNHSISMDDIPVLVVGFDSMIILVCPPSPKLKPLDTPSDCGEDFRLEKTRKIKKGTSSKSRRKKSKKTRLTRIF